ncbi:MAG TPA: PhnD/SsuA/transferrin family substrate-binding protein [Fimbriimonadaceae bacterium]|nr:PhnD/SsuA/transferrin family substrate-binding protein [Fimbriimonadaceae bacterium]
MPRPAIVGAVVYDPKVVIIWDIIKDFFEAQGCPMDYMFFSNYELQVKSLMDGAIDIAWNSPLAWLECQDASGGKCRAIAMRDTDRDRVTHWVVRSDSDLSTLPQLSGHPVAVGASDSPQATLIPLQMLRNSGAEPGSIVYHNVLVGKHGDHIGGEMDALKALMAGTVDATAMLDLNWQRWSTDGTLDPAKYRVLATTQRFDHCVFAVRDDFPAEIEEPWLKTLMSMSYANPDHREMMDLEGLKEWLPGRTSGFAALTEAVAAQGLPELYGKTMQREC